MSKIRYIVAMTLDGYVAGPNGEADWILMDPDINFAELWAQFDTFLMGRKTYEAAIARLGKSALQGRKTVVVSRTLHPADHPDLTVLS
jgi:dihydrofolate reductase